MRIATASRLAAIVFLAFASSTAVATVSNATDLHAATDSNATDLHAATDSNATDLHAATDSNATDLHAATDSNATDAHAEQYAPDSSTAETECPLLKLIRIECTKADALCCLANGFDMLGSLDAGVYPFNDLLCPFGDAVTAENICAALEQDSGIVDQGMRLVPAGQTTSSGDWTSDRYVAIAAIGDASLCFNVYGGVQPGDVLRQSCENSMIGDPIDALASIAQGASLTTAGDVVMMVRSTFAAPMNLDGALIALGSVSILDWGDDIDVSVASTRAFSGPGILNGIGFYAGESVLINPVTLAAGTQIAVGAGNAEVSSSDFNALFTAVPTAIPQTEILENRRVVEAQICSAYNQILDSDDTAIPVYSNAGQTLTIQCDSGSGMCYSTIAAMDLLAVTELDLVPAGQSYFVIRVTGSGSYAFSAPACIAGNQAFCQRLFFMFTAATGVSVFINNDGVVTNPIFPIFAPVSEFVTLDWDRTAATTGNALFGGVVVGQKSVTTIYSLVTLRNSGNAAATIMQLPTVSTPNDVVFCDCACDPSDLPEEAEYKACVVKGSKGSPHQKPHLGSYGSHR